MESGFRISVEGGNKIRKSDIAAAGLLLLYVPAGHVRVSLHDEEYLMHEQDIIIVNSGAAFTCEPDGPGSYVARMEIPSGLLAEIAGGQAYIVVCNSCVSPDADYSELRTILKAILNHYLRTRSVDYYIEGYFYLLLHLLKEQYMMTFSDAGFREQVSASDERIIRITSYVDSHYNQDISLNDLAARLHLALSYLSRFTRKALGMTFTDYVNLVRLRHVVDGFENSDRSVTKIAMENGFSNITTFNRAFRKQYGTTPSEYREKLKKESERRTMILPGDSADTHEASFDSLKEILGDKADDPILPAGPEQVASVREAASALNSAQMYRPWDKLINVGRLSDLKDNRMRSELVRVNSALKVEYARFWNVLSDDVNLGTYKGDRTFDYDFGVLDSCIDFLINNRIRPYFHFGYNLPYEDRMLAASDGSRDVNRIGSLFHFRSYTELCGVLKALLRHLLDRYGEDEVAEFRFSLWYPNLYYSLPAFMTDEDRGAYAVHLYRTIREVLPDAVIGAADFSLLFEKDRIYERIRYMADHGVKPDFVSCVSYPYRFVLQDGAVVRAWQIQAGFIHSEIQSLKSVLSRTQWSDLPIWISEYNVTLEQRNFLNDIRFKGAYIIKNMIDMCGYTEGAGYFMLSDIYSQWIDTNRILFGGCGIVSKNGIYKPAYFGLYFLSRLKKYKVASSQKYLLTTNRRGSYALVVHNYADPGLSILTKPENSISWEDHEHLFDGAAALTFSLRIDDLEPGSYRFRSSTIDAANGDIAQWIEKNDVNYGLDNSDIAYLQQRCVPELHLWSEQTDENGSLTIRCTLEPNDFILFEFSREKDL
ncbi:MAG: helix-turn-helix domain-containing protein [Lachnospiraceae bacterium]|nr:helix-turn-helix domain-containing protein [Lachnospiraceae bacterium]